MFRRLREEAPLYYNEPHDFYAVSRYEDVERGLVDRDTYSSARGGILELIKSGLEIPPGTLLFEDPPAHTVHRSLMSRVFTPKKMLALEDQIREFCARSLDPLVGAGGFDFIADIGAQMPMRVIGMLLGIPEEDQETMREHANANIRTKPGQPQEFKGEFDPARMFTRVRRIPRLAARAPVRRPDDRAGARRVRGRARRDAPTRRATRRSRTSAWSPAPATRPPRA